MGRIPILVRPRRKACRTVAGTPDALLPGGGRASSEGAGRTVPIGGGSAYQSLFDEDEDEDEDPVNLRTR